MLVIFWLSVPGRLKCILAKFELISITIWRVMKKKPLKLSEVTPNGTAHPLHNKAWFPLVPFPPPSPTNKGTVTWGLEMRSN